MIRSYFIVFALSVGVFYVEGKMTIEQVKKAGEAIRNVCQPKFKVTDELVDGIKEGKFPDDRNLKCYSNCAMEMMQSIKKGKFNYDSSLRQVETMLPDELKDVYRNSIEICKDSGKNIKDHCESAYEILQCFFKHNSKFLFP